MNKNEKSSYRTYGLEKINAKNVKRGEPKADKISGSCDLRVGGKK